MKCARHFRGSLLELKVIHFPAIVPTSVRCQHTLPQELSALQLPETHAKKKHEKGFHTAYPA